MMRKDVDSGYSWVILAVCFVSQVVGFGVVFSTGVFNEMFLLRGLEASRGSLAFIPSLHTAFFYGIGPITAYLCNVFGGRPVVICGGLISSLGLVLSALATNVYILYLTFGIMTGAGLGMSYLPTVEATCLYFTKYRALAVAIAASGVCAGTFVLPPFIRLMEYTLGYTGALYMTSCLTMQLIVCGALLRPKRKPRSQDQQFIDNKCDSLLNISIFKKRGYVLLCLNNVSSCIGLSIVLIHLSAFSSSLGYSRYQGAALFSGIGAGGWFGRLFFGFITQKTSISAIFLYTFGMFICGVSSVCCPHLDSYTLLICFALLFGFFYGSFGSCVPIIVTDMVGVDSMAGGFGYLLLCDALGILIGGPLAGYLYDDFGCYAVSFYIGGATFILSAVFTIYPWLKLTGRTGRKTMPKTHGSQDGQLFLNLAVDAQISEVSQVKE